MLFDPDGTAHPDPDYVTGYDKVVKGGKTVVTYTINPKATYNDGKPIDWRSFEATWKANRSDSEGFLPSATDGYSQIASVTQGDDAKQAVVTFKGIYAWVDGLFNNLLNPEAATPDVFNKGYLNNPHPEWGAGPYTLDTYDKKNGTISFKPNPKWWGDDKAKLDKRTYKALEDTASINAFKAGQLDATSVATKDRLAQVDGMNDIEIRRSATPSQNLLTLNGAHKILSDLDVRKAVFMGIDRKVIGKIDFQGLDYSETPPGSFSLYPFQTGYVDNLAERRQVRSGAGQEGPRRSRLDGRSRRRAGEGRAAAQVHLRQHRGRPGRQGRRRRHRGDAQEHRGAARHPPGALRRLLEDPDRQAVRHVLLGGVRSPTRSGSRTSARSTAPPAASSGRA